jgi:methyltransferase family protein
VTTRYEFLAELHRILHPKQYLEIGVQHGDSLRLANCRAIGVDPRPLVTATGDQAIFTMTSDDFFAEYPELVGDTELAFIDGMHRFEFAGRDFLNIMRFSRCNELVVVFDDVLPYTQEMASREMVPGDWTGDVWRIWFWLQKFFPDTKMALVDTWPCGSLVVWDVGEELPDNAWMALDIVRPSVEPAVPDEIISRQNALQPELMYQLLDEWKRSR